MLLMDSSSLYFTIFTLVEFCVSREFDYVEVKYNVKKNCKSEMLKKQNSRNNDRCIKIEVKWKDISPYLCKTKLMNRISNEHCRISPWPRVKATKNYMYCYDRGVIHCCFESFECVKDYGIGVRNRDIDIYKQVLKQILKYGLEVLPDIYAYKYKYRICKRAVEPNGLELCKKDCEKEEHGDFAKKCNEDPKANFKCCIMRRNLGCDVCSICCILPVCTIRGMKEELNTFKLNINETLTPGIDTHKNATEIRRHLKMIKFYTITKNGKAPAKYFNKDLRGFCLKTDQNDKNQTYYDMTAYREFTKKGKLDVPTFQIPEGADIYNPEIRKKYASSKGPKILSDIIGLDKCYKIRTQEDVIECFKKCKNLEKSKFANKCNKEDNQVFKCCVVEKRYGADMEEIQKDIMKYLVKQKFITKPLQEICTGGKCTFCCLASVCTKKYANGSVGDTYKVNLKTPLMSRYKYRKCRAFTINKSKRMEIAYFNMTEYRQAHTKDMLCEVSAYKKNADLDNIRVKNKDIKYISKYCDKKGKNMKKSSEVMKKRQSKKEREQRKNKKKHRQSKTTKEKGKKKNQLKEIKIEKIKEKGKKKSEGNDLKQVGKKELKKKSQSKKKRKKRKKKVLKKKRKKKVLKKKRKKKVLKKKRIKKLKKKGEWKDLPIEKK